MDARLQYFTTQDKIKLYYELWVPSAPKANVIFLHGLGDHVGRYAAFARYLIQRNYGFCMYDQRGHGKSGGRRMHCRSFSDFLRDLSQIVDMVQKGHESVPVFLIGHSFGGQVAINFVAKYSKGLRGLIALSPNIEPMVKIPSWKKKLASRLSNVIPIVKLQSKIDPSFFSHDECVIQAAKNDPLMNWHVTARLGSEILKNLAQLPNLAFQVKIPLLFMQGGDDRITSIEATRKFYHNILIQNKDFKTYPGLFHELLQENMREKLFNDIESWLNNQIISYKRIAARTGSEGNYEKKPDLWRHLDNSFHIG